jgi:hypothetical protein
LLKKAGLITARRSGREQIYELAPSGNRAIEEVIDTIAQVGGFWDAALNAFKDYAESVEDRGTPGQSRPRAKPR